MILPPLVWDSFEADEVPPDSMDALWASGWRHFGSQFFRYSVTAQAGDWLNVIPLRVDLRRFEPTKSQRRVLRRNLDLDCIWQPAGVTEETAGMFERHKLRFQENIPGRLEDFLGESAGLKPCLCLEFQCRLEGRLVAASYVDLGKDAVSGLYGIFDPDDARRSPGLFTLLREMLWAQENGCLYHYPGYATREPGHYDYKKQFRGLEYYDWRAEAWSDLDPAGFFVACPEEVPD